MARCKFCGRSGIFLSVNQYGLCNNCATSISYEINSTLRVIQDSIELVKTSKNLETRLSRADVVIKLASEIVDKFESKGITVMDPSAKDLLRRYKEGRDDIIKDSLEEEYKKASTKSAVGTTAKTKTNPLSKVLIIIQDYKSQLGKKESLDDLEQKINEDIHAIQLHFLLDDAKKAEFKGNKKKALDKYLEALYFIKTDKIDDIKQQEIILNIENKIKELGGVIPS